MKQVYSIAICFLPFVMGCTGSIASLSEEAPEATQVWRCAGKGWGSWGTGGDSVYAISVDPYVLDVWRWTKNTIEASCEVRADDCVGAAIISHSAWVSKTVEGSAVFCIRDFKPGKIITEWSVEADWFMNFGRKGSQDGKHWAAYSVQDGKVFGQPDTIRFGLVTPDGKGIDWAATIPCKRHSFSEMTSPLVPSNDGAYIGVAGWKNGVMMVDVVNKKIAWEVKPEWEADANDLAFTPDSKLVYVGGTEGCVYGMKVETGEIVNKKWWATRSGKSEYGYRISTVAVSPDGRFVAAGTGPTGDVYVFSTKDGSRRILAHGGSTILIISFSPDSKRLASFAAGKIKIWKLPDDPAQPQPDTKP